MTEHRRVAVSRAADDMLACYIDWREDTVAVADAYARWTVAPEPEATSRFSAYVAALDQEESSAKGYAAAVAKLARLL